MSHVTINIGHYTAGTTRRLITCVGFVFIHIIMIQRSVITKLCFFNISRISIKFSAYVAVGSSAQHKFSSRDNKILIDWLSICWNVIFLIRSSTNIKRKENIQTFLFICVPLSADPGDPMYLVCKRGDLLLVEKGESNSARQGWIQAVNKRSNTSGSVKEDNIQFLPTLTEPTEEMLVELLLLSIWTCFSILEMLVWNFKKFQTWTFKYFLITSRW